MKSILSSTAAVVGAILAGVGIGEAQMAFNAPTPVQSFSNSDNSTTSNLFITNTTTTQTAGIVYFSVRPPAPPNSFYHQVVDRYFDANGKEIETVSATHRIDMNCHPGRREQQPDVVASDDGKGNVSFTPPEQNVAQVR